MVVLVLDAAAQQILGFQLEPLTVAILCAHLDRDRAGHGAVMAREGQTALIGGLFFLGYSQNFRVDEVDELIFVIFGDLLGRVGGVPHHEQTAQHAHLRAGQTHAVGGDHGLVHVVQQGSQTVIKGGDGAADLVQDRIALFYNVTDCHLWYLQIRCYRPSAGPPQRWPWTEVFPVRIFPVCCARGRGSGGRCGT